MSIGPLFVFERKLEASGFSVVFRALRSFAVKICRREKGKKE